MGTASPAVTVLGEPENPFPEDQMLLQLDRELDQRMTNLLRPRTKSVGRRSPHTTIRHPTHHPAKTHPSGQVFRVINGHIEGRSDEVMGSTEEQDIRVLGGDRGWDIVQIRNGADGAELRGVRGDGAHGGGERSEGREREEREVEETVAGKREDEKLNIDARETAGIKDDDKEKKEEKDEEEEKEEDYAIFDEFLDVSTRARLRQMAGKVEALTQALHLAQEECRQMASSKREASKEVQAAESERRAMAKQMQGLKQESARQRKANAELRLRVKELGQECQALRKEASEARQREVSRGTGYTSLQAQLTRSKGECAGLREQLTNTRAAHKEEVEELRRRLSEGEEKRRETERERRDLRALTKKQERMIAVLTQQKNHLAAAKAVAGLEQKFLASIAPIHPP